MDGPEIAGQKRPVPQLLSAREKPVTVERGTYGYFRARSGATRKNTGVKRSELAVPLPLLAYQLHNHPSNWAVLEVTIAATEPRR